MSWRDAIRRWLASEPTPASPPSSAASPRLALPAPEARPDHPAEADETGRKLVERVHGAARQAGVQPDDPMAPLVTAITDAIGGLYTRASRSDRIAEQASQRIVDALERARLSADAETKRFKAQLSTLEADIISRVGSGVARAADQAFTRRVQVSNRNSILVAAAVLAGTGAGGLGGGFLWGHSNARADIHETETGLQAAFSTGPDDAQRWLALMTWNHIGVALKACDQRGVSSVQSGRQACGVPLWVEAPPAAVVPAPPSDVATTTSDTPPASPPAWRFPGAPPTGPVEFH